MNLDRSISNLSKRIERFHSFNGDGNDSNHWRSKAILPLKEWIRLRGTPYALQCFPDDFDTFHTFLTESQLRDSDEQTRKWYSDYLDLMEHKRNPNYGRTKCFHCLLSPDTDDPIFIGINRLVAKGLKHDRYENNNNFIQYPCPVANKFECPYGKANMADANFDVENLFELQEMAFAVEIALAVAKKDTSSIKIKNKQDLYQALTNREMFDMILEQGFEYVLSDNETFLDPSKTHEQLQKENRNKIIDYLINIKDKVRLEELRIY